jgi:hypothetical protein
MATDHDTGVSMSPQPPHDGRWAIFVPASYKNMALGDSELMVRRYGRCCMYGPNYVIKLSRVFAVQLFGMFIGHYATLPPVRFASPSPHVVSTGCRADFPK